MTKRAVVLFNLGGPDSLDAVQPFLFNLFNDPAIISSPLPLRWLIAKLISTRRAPIAKEIYGHIGGKSPLLDLTNEQAQALEGSLGGDTRVFVVMRYWHPFSQQVANDVKQFQPDEIVLLPLYPQFSGTTTGSSLKDWHQAAKRVGLNAKTHTVCCYPAAPGWVKAQTDLISKALDSVSGPQRVLFSAHGLPKKIVDKGDPYQWQVEKTAEAVAKDLGEKLTDWAICYQSRVGPLEWIGPSTEDELKRAAADKIGVIVVPIAFVSEHSETLVELDIEYRELAEELGVVSYHRVPAVGTHPLFIEALTELVQSAQGLACNEGGQICPNEWRGCAHVGS